MEGRRIKGDGIEHEQDYIKERIEQAGDTDEYAEAADVLEDELQDLKALNAQGGQTGQSGASGAGNAVRETANIPVAGDELRQGAALDITTNSVVDTRQLPPDAEARSRTTSQLEGGTGGTELGR